MRREVFSRLIQAKERRKRPRRLHDDSSTPFYDFHRYGSYGQMVSWMRALARNDPQLVQFISIGSSHEGRSIDGVEVRVDTFLFWALVFRICYTTQETCNSEYRKGGRIFSRNMRIL